ncbi:hypothetical protein HMPREF1861_01579 [Corynebacterium kroppenstedtii]|nr:hypothetical protein HMPREF1861_01579 [Corynebacterium kroppenstedtii]
MFYEIDFSLWRRAADFDPIAAKIGKAQKESCSFISVNECVRFSYLA